jgi:hypothetical protein
MYVLLFRFMFFFFYKNWLFTAVIQLMYNFLFPVMSIWLLYFCTFFLEYHPQPSTARRTGAATSSAGRRSQRTTPSQNRGATQRRGTAARRGATPKRRGRPPGSRNVRLRPIPEEETTDAQTSDDEDVNGKASNIKVGFQLCVLNIIQLLWSLYYIHHMYILLLANIFDLCFCKFSGHVLYLCYVLFMFS